MSERVRGGFPLQSHELREITERDKLIAWILKRHWGTYDPEDPPKHVREIVERDADEILKLRQPQPEREDKKLPRPLGFVRVSMKILHQYGLDWGRNNQRERITQYAEGEGEGCCVPVWLEPVNEMDSFKNSDYSLIRMSLSHGIHTAENPIFREKARQLLARLPDGEDYEYYLTLHRRDDE